MKKAVNYLIISLIIIISIFIYLINKKDYLSTDDILGVYVNDELTDKIPSKDEALFQKVVCDDENVKATWDNDSWGLLISNMNTKVKCNLYFYSGPTAFDFDYNGDEQIFTVPVSGTYKLETWGAQGGTMSSDIYGGYGGYSSGVIILHKDINLYINNGGQGKIGIAGYNGGGNASSNGGTGGGGASDITLSSGTLSTFSNKLSEIIIVSGGGGGSAQHTELNNSGSGGHAGGYIGGNGYFGTWTTKAGYGGTQSTGGSYGLCKDETVCGENGSFGQGGNLIECDTTHCNNAWQAGGGAGFYGGGSSRHSGGGGGSGYIGNQLLTNKVMYCYNCEESSEESTKTISTTCVEETPTSNCAKKGNGYTRITLVSINE